MSGEDRATAGRQAGEVFGLAGLAPIAGAGLTRAAGRPAIARDVALPSVVETPRPVMHGSTRYESGVHKSPTGFDGEEAWTARPFGANDPHSYVNAHTSPDSDMLRITASELSPELRGQGLGVELYRRMIDSAHNQGMSVGSDYQVSPHAQRVYSSLERRGYDVRQDPDAIRLKDGNLITPETKGDGELPVYTVTPKPDYLYANSKQATAPGMVVQGYRGYNPDYGIGPGVDRPQVVWATPDKGLADIFGRNTVTAPVEMRFENPYVVDAKGARFDNIPVRDGKGLLSYLAPTVRHHIDDLALDKRDAGYDGMIVKNVRETGKDNVARTADQLVALKRGTVFDPASGDLLWANSKEAAAPGLLAQVRDTVSNLSSSYGENPLQFIDRAIQGDGHRSGALMDAVRSSGVDPTAIPSAVRETYRGGQYNVGEAKQRVRELDAEIGKLYGKHGNDEKAVLSDPSYPALNNEMIALTGGAMPEPSKFARDFDALPRMNKLDLFSNAREATIPGLLAQGEGKQGITAKPDPYQYALQLQARRKALGLPN